MLEIQSQVCKGKIICYRNTGIISVRNFLYNFNVELQNTTQKNNNKNIQPRFFILQNKQIYVDTCVYNFSYDKIRKLNLCVKGKYLKNNKVELWLCTSWIKIATFHILTGLELDKMAQCWTRFGPD